METMSYPNNVGQRRRITTIHGQYIYVINEGEIVRPQGKRPYCKLIYLQKLRHESNSRIEYRFTYYMNGSKGRMLNR